MCDRGNAEADKPVHCGGFPPAFGPLAEPKVQLYQINLTVKHRRSRPSGWFRAKKAGHEARPSGDAGGPAYCAGAFETPSICASISAMVRPRVSTAISQKASAPRMYQEAK
jgi:hypothetical protein